MDHARNCTRLHCYLFLALGFLVSSLQGAEEYSRISNGSSTSGTRLARVATVTSGGTPVYKSLSPTTGFSSSLTMSLNSDLASVSMPSGSPPNTRPFEVKSQTVYYKWESGSSAGSSAIYSFEWSSKEANLTWTHGSAGSAATTFKTFNSDPFLITLTPGTNMQDITSVEDGDPVPKTYKEGVLFFDNITGLDQVVKIGDEEILLKPGYNSFPFYGEVGEDGFPKGLSPGMNVGLVEGPNGLPIFTGRLGLSSEGVPVWGTPPAPASALASSLGATIKLPNGMTPGVTDYVALPPGMTKGSNVPLPGGMTAGSPGLPPGVTPGSVGSLPNGVISGGKNNLPEGVSPGTYQGFFPNVPGGGITTTYTPTKGKSSGTGVGSGTGQQGTGGDYIPGSSMAGQSDAAKGEGKSAADTIIAEGKAALDGLGAKAEGILGADKKPWSAPDEGFFAGRDTSWLRWQLDLGFDQYDIQVPLEWISLVREILHWVLKISFVIACLRLVMK